MMFTGSYPIANPTVGVERSAIVFSLLLLMTSYSAIEFASWEARGSTDADSDGLPYALEYYIVPSHRTGILTMMVFQMVGSGSMD